MIYLIVDAIDKHGRTGARGAFLKLNNELLRYNPDSAPNPDPDPNPDPNPNPNANPNLNQKTKGPDQNSKERDSRFQIS